MITMSWDTSCDRLASRSILFGLVVLAAVVGLRERRC
jgi:hypothetical protein